MAAALEEFLVMLGFRIDESGFRTFTSATERAESGISLLTRSIERWASITGLSALGIEYGLGRIARSYSDLYYAAQRTSTTVHDLKVIQYAFEQIGLSAEEGVGAIDAFAQAIRESPGLIGMLSNPAGSTLEQFQSQIATWAQLYGQGEFGRAIAIGQASKFGLSESVLTRVIQNQERYNRALEEGERHQREIDKFIDPEKYRAYAAALDMVARDAQNLATAIGIYLLPALEGFDKLILHFQSYFQDKSAGGAEKIGDIASMALGIGVGTALGGWKGGAAGAAVASYTLAQREALKAKGMDVPWELGDTNESFLLRYYMAHGHSREEAIAIIQNFKGESGLNPLAQNLGGGGRGAVGLAGWRGPRIDLLEKFAGKPWRETTTQEQAAFAQWEFENSERAAFAQVRAAEGARAKAEALSHFYERHGNAAEDARRGEEAERANVTLNQTNNITVGGGGNPGEVGRRVGEEVVRMTADVGRNMGSKLQ